MGKDNIKKKLGDLHIFSVKQRFSDWLTKVNEKHRVVLIWWRYDNQGTPHKIGWRLFDGKIHIRYRNVS